MSEQESRRKRLEDRLLGLGKYDAEALLEKDREYGSSWKKRGGVGAFMMSARKWDRIETCVEAPIHTAQVDAYDIFSKIELDARDEGLIDDIRDLRRYLLLIEEEMMERNVIDDEHIVSTYRKKEDT